MTPGGDLLLAGRGGGGQDGRLPRRRRGGRSPTAAGNRACPRAVRGSPARGPALRARRLERWPSCTRGSRRRGATRRVVAHPARRGRRGGRDAHGGLRPAARPAPDRHRRGARRRLQVGPHPALRRALGGPPAGGLDRGAGRRGDRDSGRRARSPGCAAGIAERARLIERRVGRAPDVAIVDLRAELASRESVGLLAAAGGGARCAAVGRRAGDPAHEPAREPRRSSCAAIAARACAVPTATCRSSTTRAASGCGATTAGGPRSPRSAVRRAAAPASATSAPGRSASRRSCAPASRGCASRASTRTHSPRGAGSRASTTTSATGASTSWSAPSWQRRGSTCPA